MAKDGKALQKFYADAFGWNIDTNNPMDYGMIEAQSEHHSIGGGIGPSEQGNYVTVYIEVDDIAAYLAKVESLGGKTLVPATEIPNMVTFAMFSDPAGNMVGLVKGM